MVDDPSEIFDGIVTDEQIISRASSVSAEYDKLYQMVCARIFGRLCASEFDGKPYPMQRQLFRTLVSVNALEAIRFYVSFPARSRLASESCWKATRRLCD